MAETRKFTGELIVEHCCNCGIAFGIEAEWQKKLLNNGDWFCCPGGHRQRYTETTVERLERQLVQKQRDRDWYQGRLIDTKEELKTTNHRLAATKGVVTRMKNRRAAEET